MITSFQGKLLPLIKSEDKCLPHQVKVDVATIKNTPMLKYHSAVYYKNKIIVFGGTNNETKEFNKVYIYNLKTQNWNL